MKGCPNPYVVVQKATEARRFVIPAKAGIQAPPYGSE